jgi:acetyl-CoA carboxylase biotin carboxylase subunit
MISKLVVWAKTREEAISRMKRALYEYKITGVKTSIRFLERIMDTPDFKNGKYNTHFIDKNQKFLMAPQKKSQKIEDVAIMTVFVDYLSKIHKFETKVISKNSKSNWKECGRKKNLFSY